MVGRERDVICRVKYIVVLIHAHDRNIEEMIQAHY